MPAGNVEGGISGTLNTPSVERYSGNTYRVLNALRADAAIANTNTVSWYDVTRAGFNFVDQQCVDYFNDLFLLERQRAATKSLISAFGQTTNAILAVTNASSLSINVVAQAFGLADKVTDIVSNSFLYKLPPSTTKGFVREMQSAYRIGAAQNKANIDSPVAAFHEIQNYLELCLPPTIEARLVDHIAGARALPITSPGDTKVVVGSDTSAEEKARVATIVAPLESPKQKLPPVKKAGNTPGAINPFEASVPPAQLRQIQTLLCVAPITGKWDANTRKAFVAFYEGGGHPRPSIEANGVTANDVAPKIREALSQYKSCEHDRYKDARELGALMF